jgi:hypothetical protein
MTAAKRSNLTPKRGDFAFFVTKMIQLRKLKDGSLLLKLCAQAIRQKLKSTSTSYEDRLKKPVYIDQHFFILYQV